jgi:hypothetical protein
MSSRDQGVGQGGGQGPREFSPTASLPPPPCPEQAKQRSGRPLDHSPEQTESPRAMRTYHLRNPGQGLGRHHAAHEQPLRFKSGPGSADGARSTNCRRLVPLMHSLRQVDPVVAAITGMRTRSR